MDKQNGSVFHRTEYSGFKRKEILWAVTLGINLDDKMLRETRRTNSSLDKRPRRAKFRLGMEAHGFDSSTEEVWKGRHEFKTSMDYIVNSRLARAV